MQIPFSGYRQIQKKNALTWLPLKFKSTATTFVDQTRPDQTIHKYSMRDRIVTQHNLINQLYAMQSQFFCISFVFIYLVLCFFCLCFVCLLCCLKNVLCAFCCSPSSIAPAKYALRLAFVRIVRFSLPINIAYFCFIGFIRIFIALCTFFLSPFVFHAELCCFVTFLIRLKCLKIEIC